MGDSDPIEQLLTWPALGSGNHSEPTKRFDKWIKSLATSMKSILERVSILEKQNAEKDKIIEDLKKNGSISSVLGKNIGPNSFAQLAAQMGKSGTEANAAIIKAVKADNIMKESRASSLIISGLKESMSSTTDEIYDDDIKEVKKILDAIEMPVPIKKVYRMKRKSTEAKDSSKPRTPTPLVVELHTNEAKNQVLASAHKLAGESSFKDVYLRPNRTPAEQAEVNRLVKEKNEANEDLKKNGMLGRPFYFVIRGERLRCIDLEKERDENGHRPFANWSEACKARKRVSQSTPALPGASEGVI